MKIYIAGPMRGIEFYNFPAFDRAKESLIEMGHGVVSPADIDRKLGHDPMKSENTDWDSFPDELSLNETIVRDVEAVLSCDAIYLLFGAEKSKGAMAEKSIAEWAGKSVLYEGTRPERQFFGYGDCTFETFETEEHARKWCDLWLDEERGGTWSEESMNVRYGEILGGTVVTEFIEATDENREELEERGLPSDCYAFEQRKILPFGRQS